MLERAILEEVKKILKEQEENEGSQALKKLDQLMSTLSQKDEILSLIISPYIAIRDVINVAIPSVKLVLNDLVLIVK